MKKLMQLQKTLHIKEVNRQIIEAYLCISK